MNLSRHFTLAEMTATAVRSDPNLPSYEESEALRFLCTRVLEPVRDRFGPLYVTSGYRSKAVNTIIGGSPSSMHSKGCAADVVPLRQAVRWATVMDFLLTSVPYVDQVIYEYARWLHIGTRPGGAGCRKQMLMTFKAGQYEPFNPNDPRVTR